jgi:hypothetical protein
VQVTCQCRICQQQADIQDTAACNKVAFQAHSILTGQFLVLQAGFPFNFPFARPFPVAPLCTPGWTVNPWKPPAQVQIDCRPGYKGPGLHVLDRHSTINALVH